MAAIDFTQFHELAEQFRGEMPLKKICEQEGVNYWTYLSWRRKNGLSPRSRVHSSELPEPGVLRELDPIGVPVRSPMTTSVHIEFENGLKFDREGMEVDGLISFLTKIRGALCLG